jgi:hypothetical protein
MMCAHKKWTAHPDDARADSRLSVTWKKNFFLKCHKRVLKRNKRTEGVEIWSPSRIVTLWERKAKRRCQKAIQKSVEKAAPSKQQCSATTYCHQSAIPKSVTNINALMIAQKNKNKKKSEYKKTMNCLTFSMALQRTWPMLRTVIQNPRMTIALPCSECGNMSPNRMW